MRELGLTNHNRSTNDDGGDGDNTGSPSQQVPNQTQILSKEELGNAREPIRQITHNKARPSSQYHTDIVTDNEGHKWKHKSSYSLQDLLTPLDSRIATRSMLKNMCAFSTDISLIKPKNTEEALQDDKWIDAMQEELIQFEHSKFWHLFPLLNTIPSEALIGYSEISLMNMVL